MPAGRQPPIQLVGGADQRHVGERLREIAEMLTAMADLLREEPQVIGVAEHLLEQEARLLQVARPCQALDVPEGAQPEGALLADEPA